MNGRASKMLIYDRDCELCRWAQSLLVRWDRGKAIRYLAFQDEEFKDALPDLDRGDPEGPWPAGEPPRAMLFLNSRGEISQGVAAFRSLLPYLPGGRLVAALFYLPGFPWLAVRFYEWLARNRYRFFGPTGNS